MMSAILKETIEQKVGASLLLSQTASSTRCAAIPREWLDEFEAAARRPLKQRMRYAFIKTYKPVLDDASYRSFETMQDYRDWCEANLPDWLGYGR
jgi:hypothetical protein